MSRPIQLTSPLPITLQEGFGGAADINVLPKSLTIGYYEIGSQPNLRDGVAFQRKISIRSTSTNLTGKTISLVGRSILNQSVTENVAGSTANTWVNSAQEYTYLDSVIVDGVTTATDLQVKIGLTLTTVPINLDYYFPNTSFSVDVQVGGTGATYSVYGTSQKVILINSTGIPYVNPKINWTILSTVFNAATTNQTYPTEAKPFWGMRQAVYLSATLTDATSFISFTVLQQGLRS